MKHDKPDKTETNSARPGKRSRVRKLLLRAGCLAALGFLLGVLALAAADRRVGNRAEGRVFDNVEDVPVREYGLLPGKTPGRLL